MGLQYLGKRKSEFPLLFLFGICFNHFGSSVEVSLTSC